MGRLFVLGCMLAACRRDETDKARPDGDADTDTDVDTDPPPPVEGMADFALRVDPDIVVMLHATFSDPGSDPGSGQVSVEYRFEGDEWLVAPTTAPGEAAILGVPELTVVEARAVATIDGQTVYSPTVSATTGPLPSALQRPTVVEYVAGLASPAPWAMISVSSGNYTFQGPYYVQILDRAGRVVWYHEVPDELFAFYPSVARDGTHIWFDGSDIFRFAAASPRVTRRTLDGRWEVVLDTPGAGQGIAEGPDDSFFFEVRGPGFGVQQLDARGGITLVWDCAAHMATLGLYGNACYLNACNWDEARGTILASQFNTSTVFEVDLSTGRAVRQMGALEQGDPYRFVPSDAGFAYQHWPLWTPEGTLFVSTHIPCNGGGNCTGNEGIEGIQVAAEYEVDDATDTLTQIWSHESRDLWATQVGEAYPLPNGNFIQGYGQDGHVRELTRAGETAWEVTWPRDGSGYRVVGHLSLIDDLYALNRGR